MNVQKVVYYFVDWEKPPSGQHLVQPTVSPSVITAKNLHDRTQEAGDILRHANGR